jgi:hypothetical protein
MFEERRGIQVGGKLLQLGENAGFAGRHPVPGAYSPESLASLQIGENKGISGFFNSDRFRRIRL